MTNENYRDQEIICDCTLMDLSKTMDFLFGLIIYEKYFTLKETKTLLGNLKL